MPNEITFGPAVGRIKYDRGWQRLTFTSPDTRPLFMLLNHSHLDALRAAVGAFETMPPVDEAGEPVEIAIGLGSGAVAAYPEEGVAP